MNKRMISLMAAALALLSASGQVEFSGVGDHPVIEVTPDMNTGLKKIYVVYDTDGVSMSVNSTTGEPAKWESFYYLDGNLVMEPVPGIRWNGVSTTLDKIIPNVGYKIQEGNNQPYYCWVVNYADYYLEINDISINNDAPCTLVRITVDGHGSKIPYTTLNGHQMVLDRDIKLEYNDLVLEEDTVSGKWEQVPVVETFESLEEVIQVEPPLCSTDFILSGDRFIKQWGDTVPTRHAYFTTQAVDCGSAVFLVDDDGNKSKLEEGGLPSGSAPLHLVFAGYPSDAAVFCKWEFATDIDFENVILQFTQEEVEYTLMDAETYFVRFMVANESGTCESYGETFQITVSESSLGEGPRGDLPNVFTPGNKDDVNDIWKVTYKSLAEFHCWIFNRWGNLVYEYTDPDGGWDGTYHGKLVDTGVYYYVVTATGTDGVKYKKRGDITILNYKRGAAGTSNSTAGGSGF